MHSLLLVPVEDAAAVSAALASEADALVLHLGGDERAVAARVAAGELLRTLQAGADRPLLFVRLGGLGSAAFEADLVALLPGEPDGILLAGASGGADVQHLGAKLAVAEAELGLAEGATGIIAGIGRADGVFGLGSFRGASPRLMGLAWHADEMAADLDGDRDAWLRPDFAPARTLGHLTLFAARSAAVAAIDTSRPSGDDEAFRAECRLARQSGFNAKLATTPAQATIINAVFGPGDA